jgi:transcriptional regulator with XRE-family HTH domain
MRVVSSNEKSPSEILAASVKTLRDLRGWSQADLAAYARKASKEKVSAKTVTNVEKKAHKTTNGKVIAIADAFDVEPWQLFIPLPEGLNENAMAKYLRDQKKAVRFFRNANESGRDSILRISRLEQDTKLSEAG